MADRLDLQSEFEDFLGSRNVYYKAPESVKMKYPAIRYNRSGSKLDHANNRVYLNRPRYDGVIIDPNPDSELPDLMLDRFPMCTFGKAYHKDNLHHFPFTIYY